MRGDCILDIRYKLAVAQHIEDILYHVAHQLGRIIQILFDGSDRTHILLQVFGYAAEHIGLFIQRNTFFTQSAHLILYIGHSAEDFLAGSGDGSDGVGYINDIGVVALLI